MLIKITTIACSNKNDLIDILGSNKIEIQDPAFEYWLKNVYNK